MMTSLVPIGHNICGFEKFGPARMFCAPQSTMSFGACPSPATADLTASVATTPTARPLAIGSNAVSMGEVCRDP